MNDKITSEKTRAKPILILKYWEGGYRLKQRTSNTSNEDKLDAMPDTSSKADDNLHTNQPGANSKANISKYSTCGIRTLAIRKLSEKMKTVNLAS